MLLSHIACGPSLKSSAKRINQDLYLFEVSLLSDETSSDMRKVMGDVVSRVDKENHYRPLYIISPCDQSVFPLDMAAPEIVWEDEHPRSKMWLIMIRFEHKEQSIYVLTGKKTWLPDKTVWDTIKALSLGKMACSCRDDLYRKTLAISEAVRQSLYKQGVCIKF